MARRVDIVLSAKDEATATLRNVTKNIEGIKAPLAALGGVAAAVGAVGLGRDLVGGLRASILAASEAQLVDVRLKQALENAGQSASDQVPRLSAMASSLQNVTGVSDEAIKSGQALLIELGHLSGEALDRATRASLDLSIKTGSVESAFELVAKASAGATATLKRYGIVIKDSLPESEKFEAVLKLIEDRFGGQAVTKGRTFQGQVDRISESFNDLQEVIGKGIIESPTLTKVFDEIGEAILDLQKEFATADIEAVVKEVTSALLSAADAALIATRIVGGLGGAVLAFGRDVTDANDPRVFGHLRDFLSDTPGYQRTLADLGERIRKLQDEIAGVGPKTEAARRSVDGLSSALNDASGAVGLTTVAMGFLGVAIGVKLFAYARVGASGLLELAAVGDKTALAVMRTAGAMDAFSLATTGQKIALTGLVAGVSLLSYELTRAILRTTGLDRELTNVFSKWMHAGHDAADAFTEVEDNLSFVDRALRDLGKSGVRIDVDAKKLDDLREKVTLFNVYANAKGKVKLTVETAQSRAELSNLREELQRINQLQNKFPREFKEEWDKTAKAGLTVAQRIMMVEQALEGVAAQAKVTSVTFDDALEAVNIKPLSKVREEAGRLEVAFAKLQEEVAAGRVSLDQYSAVSQDLAKAADKIRELGVEVKNVPTLKIPVEFENVGPKLTDLGPSDPRRLKVELDLALTGAGLSEFKDAEDEADKLGKALQAALDLSRVSPSPKLDELIASLEKSRAAALGVGETLGDTFTAEGLDDFLQRLRDLGATLDVDVAQRSKEVSDAWREANDTFAATPDIVTQEDIERLRELIQAMVDAGEVTVEGFTKGRDVILSLDEALRLLADDGLAKFNERLKDSGGSVESLGADLERNLRRIGVSAIDGLAVALVDAARDGKAAFADFFKAFLRQIAIAIARAIILKAIMSYFGLSGFSSGGIAQPNGRPTDPSLIANTGAFVPGVRAASGMSVPGVDQGRDSVPAIVRPGELILPVSSSNRVVKNARDAGVAGAIAGPRGVGLSRQFLDFVERSSSPENRRQVLVRQAVTIAPERTQVLERRESERAVAIGVSQELPLKLEVEFRPHDFADAISVRVRNNKIRLTATDIAPTRLRS